ncbi:Imm27 family immunity protein [Gracilimonas sp.]|uniref:Imm27 family immunity protein n=1 Tax=Gracilimonas sp. TaxID=1974203 RepID=UPI0032EE1C78
MKKEIGPEESKISGGWIETEDGFSKDETYNRIEYLTENYLEKLAVDKSGWEILYRAPNDGRFWVKWFPQSEMHGGGPPELKVIEANEAKKKFSHG